MMSKPCWECLKRRLVCDLGRPGCQKCESRDTECPGYGKKPLRWLHPGQTRSKGRRAKNESNVIQLALKDTTEATTLFEAIEYCTSCPLLMHPLPLMRLLIRQCPHLPRSGSQRLRCHDQVTVHHPPCGRALRPRHHQALHCFFCPSTSHLAIRARVRGRPCHSRTQAADVPWCGNSSPGQRGQAWFGGWME